MQDPKTRPDPATEAVSPEESDREPKLALDRRGGLDLTKDRSAHRRFASLYDDLLT